MKVLIVDDNQEITCMLSEFLKAKGVESIVINDSTDCLEKIGKEKFDIILLDISMPEFSGIDIIHTLERQKILKDQKIVIFSAVAFTDNEIYHLLQKKGIHGCLKKPIDLGKLYSTITS